MGKVRIGMDSWDEGGCVVGKWMMKKILKNK